MGATGLVIDPAFRLHETGLGHPESPRRLEAIERELDQRGVLQRCRLIQARPAVDRELRRCHTARYLDVVRREVAYGARELSTGDTAIGEHSEDAARLAAGGTLAAVDAVLA
ncbi:MAG: histone deacetylase, partial [Cyanobium sp. Prado107]|nr:histone deacetylase [Cyanobium sp. Prado107]